MIVPRSRRAQARYGRHKVIAILVTFPVVWLATKFFFPQWVASFGPSGFHRSAEELFRERRSDVLLEIEGVVEGILPDTTVAGALRPTQRLRIRTHSGHPLTVWHEPSARRFVATPAETVRVRGTYRWDLKGGLVLTSAPDGEPGWIERPGTPRTGSTSLLHPR